MLGSGEARKVSGMARRAVAAATFALAALVLLPLGGTAHTCTPDPQVGVGGRLLLPQASGLSLVELPGRAVRSVPIAPAQGVVTSVALAPDGSRLAVARFWRPPDQQVGGQDILLVPPQGGTAQVIPRSQPGESLGTPSWLPDGSLVFERQSVAGWATGARIEHLSADGVSRVLAEPGLAPTASPDGALFAYIRPEETDQLVIGDTSGSWQRVLVDHPEFISLAFPRFSPDGAWIAFAAAGAPVGSGSGFPDTQRVTASTESTGPLRWPGILAAPVADAHGIPWDIWIVRPDGSDLRRVTHFYDDDPAAAWSPDGRWLAVLSGEALHVVAVDGPANFCIAAEGGYGRFEWLP